MKELRAQLDHALQQLETLQQDTIPNKTSKRCKSCPLLRPRFLTPLPHFPTAH